LSACCPSTSNLQPLSCSGAPSLRPHRRPHRQRGRAASEHRFRRTWRACATGASGIGLVRSEFLFLNRNDLPGEDEQYEAYRDVVQAMEGLPVTIRSLDLGADKTGHGAYAPSQNPALGLRAIRYCLAEPQMFLAQLRAILRASHYGRSAVDPHARAPRARSHPRGRGTG
jgi:hypothetical protein